MLLHFQFENLHFKVSISTHIDRHTMSVKLLYTYFLQCGLSGSRSNRRLVIEQKIIGLHNLYKFTWY